MGFPLQVVNSPAVVQQGGATPAFFKTRRDESTSGEERGAGCVCTTNPWEWLGGGNPPAPSFGPKNFPGVQGAASWALLWEEQLKAQQNGFICVEWPQISAPCMLPLDLQDIDEICGEMGLFWDGSGSFLPSLKARQLPLQAVGHWLPILAWNGVREGSEGRIPQL